MTIDKSMIKRLVTQTFPNGGDKYFDYEEEFDALCRAIEAAAQAEKQEPYKRGMTLQECADAEYKQEPVAWVGCGECDCEFPCYHGKTTCLRLPTEKQEPVKDEPVAYLAGMYRSVIEGKAENIPLGATISFINMGWKNQIELYTRPQPDLTAEVEFMQGKYEEMLEEWLPQKQRIAELEEAAREARDLQYKLHVVEAIAKLDAVLGNAELKRGSTTPTKASDA